MYIFGEEVDDQEQFMIESILERIMSNNNNNNINNNNNDNNNNLKS